MRKHLVIVILLLVLVPSVVSQKSVSRMFPVYENGGKPDLVVDPQRFVKQMEIVDQLFPEGSCAIEEKGVSASGYRRILRFNTVVMNSGDGDLIVGDRDDPNNPFAEFFEVAPCHGHFHIRDFGVYELLSLDRKVVLASHKQGFCMEDSLKSGVVKSKRSKQLTGQWIDITGVPEGEYVVRVSINTANTFDEGANRYTNSLETTIHVPNPRNKVRIDDSPAVLAK